MIVRFSTIAPAFTHISADVFHMAVPVWASDYIDTKFAVFSVTILVLLISGWLEVYARCQSNKLVQVPSIIDIFDMSQSIEHLRRAHRVSNVVDFGLSCLLHDQVHESWIIV